jgi:hypothetical protein
MQMPMNCSLADETTVLPAIRVFFEPEAGD